MTVGFQRIALIGLGLIGSSISLALKRADYGGAIVGSARSDATRRTALALGLVDHAYAANVEAVQGADLVILCTPVGTYRPIAREIAGELAPGAVVSDVGSVKGAVIRDIAPELPDHAHFVPAHPIAGSELSGPEAGFAELFDNRWCILTPHARPGAAGRDDAAALARVDAFWRALGARVEHMTAEHHDLVLAITSHLPHLVAFNMVNAAADLAEVTDSDVIKFSAGGFRDFTRIAASDPTMWRDVFLNNREATLEMLGRFNEDLTALQRAIRRGDGDLLHERFAAARAIRRRIIDAGQDTPAPDFGRRGPIVGAAPASASSSVPTEALDEDQEAGA